MITLYILIVVFIVVYLLKKIFLKQRDINLSGRIAMSSMLIFTGIGHFVFSPGMIMMLPPFIPFKKEIIIFTGLIEILAAIGLLISRWQKLTSILLIIFFIVLLPANIYAAFNHVNLQKASFDGNGPAYLLLRVPLQLLFIGWVWYFGYLKRSNQKRNGKI